MQSMSEPAVDLVLGLPVAMSCELLCVWLCVPSLVRLDSAYCVHKNRPNLLALYIQPELLFTHSCPEEGLPWIMERRIRLSKFIVCEELPAELAVAYLKVRGQHIKILQVQYGASADVIEAITAYCPNVCEVEVYQLDNEIIEMLNHQRNVERLDFSLTDFEPERTATLLEQPQLRKLVINWHQALDNEEFMCCVVSKCPELTHFSLRFGYSLLEFPGPALFAGLTKLVALSFDSPSVDDEALSIIVNCCPLIEHLDLRDNTVITDIGLYHVATKLKLKSLIFYSTGTITDCGLLHLRHCAHTLKILHIAQTAAFPGHGINQITLNGVHSFRSCTHLAVYDWRSVVWFSPFNLIEYACATTIVFSVAATDAFLSSVAEHCTQLQHLNIVQTGAMLIPQYTSAGLYTVIHSCPLLQTIRVNENMNQNEFGDIMRQYKHLFVCSSDYGESGYDVMNM